MSEKSQTPKTDAECKLGAKHSNSESPFVTADFARTLETQLAEAVKAAGFCEKHKPDGGARTCLVCGCETLTSALDKISYTCGEPNEHGLSEYGNHYDEEVVIKQVNDLKTQLQLAHAAIAVKDKVLKHFADKLDGYSLTTCEHGQQNMLLSAMGNSPAESQKFLDDNKRMRSFIEKLTHRSHCPKSYDNDVSGDCNCGLDAVLSTNPPDKE